MKLIAAALLAGLLAVMAYGIFWLVCLKFTTTQMQAAVAGALNAEVHYGTPQWVPDPLHVTMDLPAARLVMRDGPVREVRAASLRLVSDFLMRDRWVMELPERVELVLANGKTLLLETERGQVLWLEQGGRLSLRAAKVRLVDLGGNDMAQVADVLLERRADGQDGNGVRVNLASRPRMAGGEAVLSGQLVMPPAALAGVVNLFGNGRVPGLGEMVKSVVADTQKQGGTLVFDNVTFRMPGGTGSGGLTGRVSLAPSGAMSGELLVTADSAARVFGWVQRAGLLMPRTKGETTGVARFVGGLAATKATARMENMQSTLMLNGFPVGPMPQAMQVAGRLWP